MIRKYIHRYQRWQEDVPLTSAFVVFCGIIAVVYFFYRILLVVSPAYILEQNAFNPHSDTNIVCGEDEGNQLKDPTPILSAQYQKRIHDQTALGANLVANADLATVDPATDQPTGYSHSVDDTSTTYVYLRDSDNTPFLRTLTSKSTSGATAPSWQMDPVTTEPERTYAYSFWYRSSVPLNVSTETSSGGKPAYADVTTLQPSSSWQQFAAHFDNDKAAQTLRIDLNGSAAGQVDLRSLDIHQIADAGLGQGLVSVTFDDGWQSVSDKALALLQKYHIRSTQFIISEVASRAVVGYMNFSEIQHLKRTGQEIGSHTLTHCDQTQLKTADLQRNALNSKQILEQQKLGPIKSFAYPLGQYNAKTQTVYQKYYPLIRSSDFGYNDRYFDETNIHSLGVVNTTSDKEFQSWLDFAKTHHLWVVLVYHKIGETGEYNVTPAQLERQLRMIKASQMQTLPLGDAAATIRK